MDKEFRREIILDNYEHPFHNHKSDETYKKIRTNNESCIDDLNIYFKIENNIVKDVSFEGEACAISTSATSIMLKNLIGKTIDEVKVLIENYKNMINEQEYEKDLLKELNAYDEIYLQPNRKTCALLPVKAIEEVIKENDN